MEALYTGIGVIVGMIAILGIAKKTAKIPLKMIKNVVDEAVKPLITEFDHRQAYNIITFEQDVRIGQQKTGSQWDYVIYSATEYIKSGKNGKVKSAAEYIMAEYEKHKENSYTQTTS